MEKSNSQLRHIYTVKGATNATEMNVINNEILL